MNDIKHSLFLTLTIYITQYLIMPLFIHISSSDSFRINLAISISTLIISTMFMLKGELKLKYLFLNIFIYYGIVYLYHPDGVYGIGHGFLNLPEIDIAVLSFIVIVSEFSVWLVFKNFKWIKGNKF